MAGCSSSDVGMEDATTGLRLHPEAMAVQGVVLVVLDVNKDICMQALNWALGHVARKGDALRLVGVLSHVLNPMGYKCRLDENSWLGANRRILENELITKQHMLANIEDLERCCERAGVTVTVEVKAGLHPKMIVVEEAKKHGAYHVVLDRSMKKDRKYFIDNLTCFVTRVRNSGGVDSVRSFALSKPLMPVVPSSNISFRLTSFPSRQFASAAPPGGGGGGGGGGGDRILSNKSSFNSSLRGSSLSSTTYNQDTHEFLPHQLWKQDSMGSSGASRRSSCDSELFSLNPVSEPSTTATEAAFEISRKRPVAQHSQQELWPKAPRPDVHHHDLTLSLHHSGSLPGDSPRALSLPATSRALVTSRTNAFFSRSISAVSSADRVASGRIGVREKASKSVWLWTSSKEVMTSALENGWTTFIFTADTKDLADDWTMVARIRPLLLEGDQFVDTQNRQVAALSNCSSGEPLDHLMGRVETVIVNGLESEVTATERMVTAFQGCSTSLYAVAKSASEAQLYVEALQGKGTDGIVLQTEDPSQVYALKAYLRGRREATMGVRLVTATVTLVEPVGLGDRVCVDLCNLLHPGEGLLVGSFARALFLVHSEWSDIDQTSSRPFRVNAGPVHAYVGMAGGVTSYLSELHTGSHVMVVDAQGRTRTVLVGRVKIEQRPLLLVEVEVQGQRHSVLLQNCDSVCLVSPGDGMNGNAIPVTSLKRGHSLLLNMQDEEREIGIETQRRAVEK